MGYTNHKKTENNSITISARGTIEYVSFWREPIYPIVRLLSINCNEKIVIPKFLFYKLKQTRIISTRAVQKQVTKPMISNLAINIPSLNDQQKIIDIIEPLEKMKNYFCSLNEKILIFIKNINLSSEKNKISHFLTEIKNKPLNIEQISAKVLTENKGFIIKKENKNTYLTNTFFFFLQRRNFCFLFYKNISKKMRYNTFWCRY